MEDSRNPNFYGIGGEDEDYRRSMIGNSRFLPNHRSISEQNHLVNNVVAMEAEHMRRQHSAGNMDSLHQTGVPYYSISAGTGQMWHQQSFLLQHGDISSADSHSRIYSLKVPAGETEMVRQQQSGQCHREDISSADSHSRRKIPATEERKLRKREANRAHMEVGKEGLETLQAEMEQLKLENESLRQVIVSQKKQIDDLKKYQEQHEALEAENRKLKDKYIELLEKSNPLVDPRFGTHPIELGQQRVQSFSRASACGSVTGHPTNPF